MSEQGLKRRRWFLNTVAGFLISGGAIWWLFQTVNLDEIRIAVLSAHYIWLLGAVFATCLSYLLRSYRWPQFFKYSPLSFRDSFRCLIVGFFMNNILPMRLGEFVRAHIGGRAAKQSRTYVLATIAAERLADGLTISILFALLFSAGAQGAGVEEGRSLLYVAWGFAVIAFITGLVIYYREFAFTLLRRLGERFPGTLSGYTLTRVHRFIEGLEPLLQPKRTVSIAIQSTLIWLVELSVYYFVAKAFHQPMSLAHLGLFLAAVNFSSLIPAAPGGVGVIEAFATLALVHVGINKEVALAMVVTQHSIQWLLVNIPGSVFFFTQMHGKLPEVSSEDENGVLLESEKAPSPT